MAVRRGRGDADKEKFWLSAFERYAASGLSQRKFCEQEHPSEKLFCHWFRRYRQGKLANGRKPPESKPRPIPAESLFVPVRVTPAKAAEPAQRRKAPIEIFTAQGFLVRMPLDADEQSLTRLLTALSKSSC